jgi:hypothetical protein
MVAASGHRRTLRAMEGKVRERGGRRGRWQRGEERHKAGVIDRAGGSKKQQSANDGDDREQGCDNTAGD